MTQQANFFDFEADFVDSLRCIPMYVRLKLDTCGIKLKLSQWHHLSPQARQTLVELSCETQPEINIYRHLLQQLVYEHTRETATALVIEPDPDWKDSKTVPASVAEHAQNLGIYITLADWAGLTIQERFALIKLSRSSHENHNFLPALKEFQLI